MEEEIDSSGVDSKLNSTLRAALQTTFQVHCLTVGLDLDGFNGPLPAIDFYLQFPQCSVSSLAEADPNETQHVYQRRESEKLYTKSCVRNAARPMLGKRRECYRFGLENTSRW